MALNNDGVRYLSEAILLQAQYDYAEALFAMKKAEVLVKELEEFFSESGEMLASNGLGRIDETAIQDRVKQEVEKKFLRWLAKHEREMSA